jgi:hypothetical protein
VKPARFIGALYALELAVLLAALALYKKGTRPLPVFLARPAGIALVVALLTLAAATFVIVREVRTPAPPAPPGARRLAAPLLLNLCSILIAFATAEIAIRVLAVDTVEGPMFANTLLLPRSWERLAARSRTTLAKAAGQGSFLIYDRDLGWTVGPNRRSRDYNREAIARLQRRALRAASDSGAEIYLSSVEGLRSPQAGISFAGRRPPPRHRIALVGDSFTFGLEVHYEDTWGNQLERVLGPEFQVLNFGVDGYGVDQAYLRYQRDVLAWHPDVVILGVINDDLRRTMCVYAFLCFPGFEMPFAKPRFTVSGDTLVPRNVPLPPPDSLFMQAAIADLPFIAYDPSFDPAEWEWHPYDHSYAIRFVLSKFRRWPVPGPAVTEAALRTVNGEVLRAFVRRAREHGATPIVVFFPSRTAFLPEPQRSPSVAQQVLSANAIPYVDMTECVSRVSPAERFVTLHYSAVTNAAIARCLRDAVLTAAR